MSLTLFDIKIAWHYLISWYHDVSNTIWYQTSPRSLAAFAATPALSIPPVFFVFNHDPILYLAAQLFSCYLSKIRCTSLNSANINPTFYWKNYSWRIFLLLFSNSFSPQLLLNQCCSPLLHLHIMVKKLFCSTDTIFIVLIQYLSPNFSAKGCTVGSQVARWMRH